MKICKVNGCKKTGKINYGWCVMHYTRWRKHGDPLVVYVSRHGMKGTSEYNIWHSMKQRCRDKNQRCYKNYGGRGIKICSRWEGVDGFLNFYEDMGERPTLGHSIDRRDNNGDYTPENCYWATPKEQANNKRDTRRVTAFGITKSVSEWIDDERCSVSYGALFQRLYVAMWEPEKAITQKGLRSWQP